MRLKRRYRWSATCEANNLNNIAENTAEAESRIRDTNIAEEMVDYSNNQILMQAGASVLSQANHQSEMILSLLG